MRADYAAEKEKGKRFSFAEGEKASKEILEQTGELCAKTGRQTVRGLKRVGVWLWGVLLFWKAQISRPIAWMKQKLEAYRDQREESAQMQACEWEQTEEEKMMTEEEQTADMKRLRQQEADAGRAGQPQNRIYAAGTRSRRKSGRNMAKSVVCLLYTSSLQPRMDNFKAYVESHSDIKVLDTLYNNNDLARAQADIENQIATYGEQLIGIYGANNVSGDGIALAVENAGIADKVITIGVDSDPTEIAALEAGNIDCIIIQDAYGQGYASMQNAVETLLQGKNPESEQKIACLLYTSAAHNRSPLMPGLPFIWVLWMSYFVAADYFFEGMKMCIRDRYLPLSACRQAPLPR